MCIYIYIYSFLIMGILQGLYIISRSSCAGLGKIFRSMQTGFVVDGRRKSWGFWGSEVQDSGASSVVRV